MTVDELVDELNALPPTATVVLSALIRSSEVMSVSYDEETDTVTLS